MKKIYDHKMSYWVTCYINKGNMNGKKKIPPQQSSPLSFDMLLSLKYSVIILLWFISSQKNNVLNQKV